MARLVSTARFSCQCGHDTFTEVDVFIYEKPTNKIIKRSAVGKAIKCLACGQQYAISKNEFFRDAVVVD